MDVCDPCAIDKTRRKFRFNFYIKTSRREAGSVLVAGETGFEPATNGFGDRYSTVELLPCIDRYYTASEHAIL